MSDEPTHTTPAAKGTSFLGLRTAIYSAPKLDAARAWYSDVLGIEPYFNEPFYVGFNVAGYELGLVPDGQAHGRGGVTVYWGVGDIERAVAELLAKGARVDAEVSDVGGGIKVATVLDPWDNVFGIIENPHFQLP